MPHTLIVTIETESEVEAYKAVNEVSYTHDIKKAKLDDKDEETFDESHPPKDFNK